MFEWDDKYLVGRADIDAEHKALFRHAQELHLAIEEDRAQVELASLFARLAAYTRFHFAGEEELMRHNRFPGMEQHLREHQKLAGRVAQLEREFESGKSRVDRSTLQLLRQWLNHHVLDSDQSIAGHLRDAR